MQFFYVMDTHGNYLSVMTSGRERGKVCVSFNGATQENTSKLYAFALYECPKVLFLCSEDESILLRLADRPFIASPFPVGIEGGIFPHTISLYDLQDHSWISIPPLSPSISSGEEGVKICGMARQKLDWEAARLEDVAFDDVPQYIQKIAVCYAEFYSIIPNLDSIKRVLFSPHSNEIKRNIINAFYPLLGVSELDAITNELRHSCEFRRQFLEVFTNDFWCKHALLPLIAWEQGRISESVIICDQKYDHLDQYFKESEFSSFMHAINCVYRRGIQPRKRTCVVTTVRNEGSSILEWIAWYKKLGFEHFFIFSNDNDDGSDDLLQALASAGVITWIKNEMGVNTRPQAKVCKYAFSVLPDVLDYEWCLVLDIDEFLSINRDLIQNITGLLRWVERNKVDAIGFNWQYTASCDISDCKQLITQRVKYFIDDSVIGLANNLIKSISKPRYMISAADHCAIWSFKYHAVYRLIQGDIHRYSSNNDFIWADFNHRGIANVIHYHYKSAREFLLRLYRGNALDVFSAKNISLSIFDEELILTFLAQHKRYGSEIQGNFLFEQYELKGEIDSLLSLPHVAEAYCNTMKITEGRISLILEFMVKNKHLLGENALKLLDYAQS